MMDGYELPHSQLHGTKVADKPKVVCNLSNWEAEGHSNKMDAVFVDYWQPRKVGYLH